ncbi:hypothetical protein [Legionella bononiensis]|uniref:Uncharacterized protein n=1 Tax=Legionella bononiensis TaxID=2793102 RepID=A0ABS1WD88_9GAMM|nr:hypothetical protein [Legionella bononiensis]MBL7481217.1 hypothetical protein [Legionella bononiensis]MBL7527323.1 hypothetical protein [Legionella bononiensis]MBL7562292.1 hypothetical protein [Legionella bononiensis]
MYDLVTKYIEKQTSLPQKNILLAELEHIQQCTDELPLLREFILKLYDIAEKKKFLNRVNASSPIQKITEYPPIYQAIKSLVDYAVQLKVKEYNQITTQEQLNQFLVFFPANLRFNTRELFIDAMQYYFRISLITGLEGNLEQFNWWKDTDHYFKYPMKLFKAQKTICDRLDVDAMISHKHFSTRPLEQAISRQDTEYQIQPGYISLGTDKAAQYNPKTELVTQLLHPYYKTGRKRVGYPVKTGHSEQYPIRLLSTRITNCHTVIIHDSRNQYIMLHVSPSSVTGGSDNMFISSIPKVAYLDLQPKYTNPDLGLQKDSTIDIVVVDNASYFNLTRLKNILPEGVTINSVQKIKPDLRKGQPYAVCFVPDENKLYIKAFDYFVEHASVFKPLSQVNDLATSQVNHVEETPSLTI